MIRSTHLTLHWLIMAVLLMFLPNAQAEHA